jgi:hypothetical protein
MNKVKKNSSKYKKINYKRTGQIFQEVYNIVDYTDINFNNINNRSEKKAINQNTRVAIFDNTFQRSFN